MSSALASQQELFDIPDDVTYLNCAYMAPQLKAVTAAGVEAVGRKTLPWTITAADFFAPVEEIRGLVAALIGGDADGVALAPSAAYGITL
ncbi:MAG TPA: hypothetical protein VML96_10085, partial [Egibacteraceae bacterium]|nr:hypothetical protein [Egibacteraceae bacterium]